MDVVVWVVDHAEIVMLFGKKIKMIKSMVFLTNLVSKFQTLTLKDLICQVTQNIIDLKIIVSGPHKLRTQM